MIIGCERCGTNYELEDALLAPEGSEVQCARCQHVFLARVPQAPPAVVPAKAPEVPPEPEPASRREVDRPAPARPASVRPGPMVYRPPISGPLPSRSQLVRRDTAGSFERRHRRGRTWRWLAPALAVLVLGLGAGAYLDLRRRTSDPAARQAQAEALTLALRDDVSSLEQAAAQLEGARRTAPRLDGAEADRALVKLLLAGVLSDSAADATDPGAKAEGRRERSRALATEAGASLEALEQARRAPAEVARARAVGASLAGDRTELKRLLAAAHGRLSDDPLVAAAEHSAEVRSADRNEREHGVKALQALATRRPDVLRVRYLLARGQALSGRRAEALSTLEQLLRANPGHEGAVALRDSLTRAPVTSAAPAPSGPTAAVPPATSGPAPAARAEKPVTLPRKPGSTAGEPGASPSQGEARPARSAQSAAAAAGATEAGGDRAPAEPESPLGAPRLRPAAVPEPEVVQGGG